MAGRDGLEPPTSADAPRDEDGALPLSYLPQTNEGPQPHSYEPCFPDPVSTTERPLGADCQLQRVVTVEPMVGRSAEAVKAVR